ncbi:MAG: transcription elongation factor GreAB [Verrucomicrobiales bacterium]|jgi:transcription elongation GreA/GreB family factor|nr:transcription elongation factor GreAB [Verrucomicrobiales bacterium]MBT6451033.1 transcription elongation factor GreAB [Verrucomicrobiales bacterium]
MTKRLVIQKIIETLQSEMETYVRAAKFSHAEATAEENRAENKYDTRGLEASYLAAGQANKIVDIEESIAAFDALRERKFSEADGIDIGALIEISQDGERAHYFIGPSAGGIEIKTRGTEVLVITPQSPLGSQLKGAKQGAKIKINLAGRKQLVEILNAF